MSPITPPGQTREKVYRFVRQRLLEGRPPSIREVQEAFGFRALGTAHEHLEKLVAEGRLRKLTGKSRGYQLPRPRQEPDFVMVPLLGRVQAGALTTAVEDREGYLPLLRPRGSRKEEFFALRVEGQSMRDAGILPGDLVIVRQQDTARTGDIVVALVEDEATVKRLRLRRRKVELHPENPEFPVLTPDPTDVRILGKVVEVRRHLETLEVTS